MTEIYAKINSREEVEKLILQSEREFFTDLASAIETVFEGEVPKIIAGTVMNPPEVLTFLARVKNAPLIRETVHYFGTCEGGKVFLIDLSDVLWFIHPNI